MIQNILFKLAKDDPKHQIYINDDELAAKAAGHDLRVSFFLYFFIM